MTPARKRRGSSRRTAGRDKAPFQAPAEFAGLTERECCSACASDPMEAAAVQRRLNELESAYPRSPSRLKNAPTVMESDGEWLARNPHIAEEFRRLNSKDTGKCVISGVGICCHPLKTAFPSKLMGDAEAFSRYQRAKKALAHRKIDLQGT